MKESFVFVDTIELEPRCKISPIHNQPNETPMVSPFHFQYFVRWDFFVAFDDDPTLPPRAPARWRLADRFFFFMSFLEALLVEIVSDWCILINAFERIVFPEAASSFFFLSDFSRSSARSRTMAFILSSICSSASFCSFSIKVVFSNSADALLMAWLGEDGEALEAENSDRSNPTAKHDSKAPFLSSLLLFFLSGAGVFAGVGVAALLKFLMTISARLKYYEKFQENVEFIVWGALLGMECHLESRAMMSTTMMWTKRRCEQKKEDSDVNVWLWFRGWIDYDSIWRRTDAPKQQRSKRGWGWNKGQNHSKHVLVSK